MYTRACFEEVADTQSMTVFVNLWLYTSRTQARSRFEIRSEFPLSPRASPPRQLAESRVSPSRRGPAPLPLPHALLDMAFRTRLPISDILHRGLVWSLLGVSVWGVVMIGVVHRNTLQAGRGAYTPLSVGSVM